MPQERPPEPATRGRALDEAWEVCEHRPRRARGAALERVSCGKLPLAFRCSPPAAKGKLLVDLELVIFFFLDLLFFFLVLEAAKDERGRLLLLLFFFVIFHLHISSSSSPNHLLLLPPFLADRQRRREHAQVRPQCRERVRSHLGPRPRQRGQHRRLPGVGRADEPDVGDDAQQQPQLPGPFARLPFRIELPRVVVFE